MNNVVHDPLSSIYVRASPTDSSHCTDRKLGGHVRTRVSVEG